MNRSAARSLTRRNALANDARKALATYQQLTKMQQRAEQGQGDQVDPDLAHDQAVKRLLWAEAHIQRALYLQTSGRAGRRDATLVTVLREYEQDKGQRPS